MISPTVAQHMPGFASQGSEPTQQSFDKKFGDAAFNAFKSKYPSLTSYIVTFKIIESDMEQSKGIATFIVTKGNDVVYIPVVLSNGAISSCEMVYDKKEDTLTPLLETVVKDISNQRFLSEARVQGTRPNTEDTRDMFRNFFRPPSSTNPVLASDSSTVENLPNEHKEKIAEYLKDNPQVLAKIAEFYPVEQLAEKLAASTTPLQEDPLPNVLDIDDLSTKIAAELTAEQKQDVLTNGWLIRNEPESPSNVLSFDKLAADLTDSMHLEELSRDDLSAKSGTANIFVLNVDRVESTPCVIVNGVVYTRDGWFTGYDSLVVSNFQPIIGKSDLLQFGAETPTEFTPEDLEDGSKISFLAPTKSGGYTNVRSHSKYELEDVEKRDIDGVLVFHNATYNRDFYVFTPSITKGFVSIDSTSHVHRDSTGNIVAGSKTKDKLKLAGVETVAMPTGTLILSKQKNIRNFYTRISKLYSAIVSRGAKLSLVNDGVNVTLVDETKKAAQSFSKKAELVDHLIHNYSFTKTAIHKLLDEKKVLVFEKEAFLAQRPQVEEPQREAQPSRSMHVPQYAPGENQMAEFDPSVIEHAAEIGDKSVFDTGMIASVAGADDIKMELVDMTPNFIETMTLLGKTIMILTFSQEEMEEYYGREQFQGLLTNVRRVFKTLGEIVMSLKKYINMN